jgi:tetratricopeptide (TPR) repeat protein
MLKSQQVLRREKTLVSAIAVLILVLVVAVVLLDHYVFSPKNPNTLSYELTQGLSDAAGGECSTAIPLLSSALPANSKNVAAAESLGQCYSELGENDSALSLLQTAAAFEPSFSNELALARGAFFSGHIAVVQFAMKKAAVKASSPLNVLAVVLTDQSYGVYRAADAALRRTPIRLRTYEWYSDDAATQLDLGNPTVAVAAAKRAVRLAPTLSRGVLLEGLGNTYASAGEYAAAADAYQEALSTRQSIDSATVYVQLAQCYINLNRLSKALQTTHIGIDDTTGADRSNLEIPQATALVAARHTPQAIRVLERIVASSSSPANDVANASAMLSALGH